GQADARPKPGAPAEPRAAHASTAPHAARGSPAPRPAWPPRRTEGFDAAEGEGRPRVPSLGVQAFPLLGGASQDLGDGAFLAGAGHLGADFLQHRLLLVQHIAGVLVAIAARRLIEDDPGSGGCVENRADDLGAALLQDPRLAALLLHHAVRRELEKASVRN